MKKLLHCKILGLCLLFSTTLLAQQYHDDLMDVSHEHRNHHDVMMKQQHDISSTTSSFHIEENSLNQTQNTIRTVASTSSLFHIMTSDEGADINCFGGFCMMKSHFHKKGLTNNRQLFNYFIRISG